MCRIEANEKANLQILYARIFDHVVHFRFRSAWIDEYCEEFFFENCTLTFWKSLKRFYSRNSATFSNLNPLQSFEFVFLGTSPKVSTLSVLMSICYWKSVCVCVLYCLNEDAFVYFLLFFSVRERMWVHKYLKLKLLWYYTVLQKTQYDSSCICCCPFFPCLPACLNCNNIRLSTFFIHFWWFSFAWFFLPFAAYACNIYNPIFKP